MSAYNREASGDINGSGDGRRSGESVVSAGGSSSLFDIEGAVLVEETDDGVDEDLKVVEVNKGEKVDEKQEEQGAPAAAVLPVVEPVEPKAAPLPAAAATEPLKHASLNDPRVPLAELVRCNASKQYGDLAQQELEVYLTDAEFAKCFRMTRKNFYQLSQWRQQNQKRSVGLF